MNSSEQQQPVSQSASDASLEQSVRAVIEMIRPAIQADGGDVQFVGIDPGGVVRLRLEGACVGCPSAGMTLHMGIERFLREKVPQVSGVIAED